VVLKFKDEKEMKMHENVTLCLLEIDARHVIEVAVMQTIGDNSQCKKTPSLPLNRSYLCPGFTYLQVQLCLDFNTKLNHK